MDLWPACITLQSVPNPTQMPQTIPSSDTDRENGEKLGNWGGTGAIAGNGGEARGHTGVRCVKTRGAGDWLTEKNRWFYLKMQEMEGRGGTKWGGGAVEMWVKWRQMGEMGGNRQETRDKVGNEGNWGAKG